MKVAEIRELAVDDLRAREKDLGDQLFRLRIQKSMGQLETPVKLRLVRRDLAKIKTVLRERQGDSGARRLRDALNGQEETMSVKSQVTGTVVSDKMEKTVVVAVERQVRHSVYGKIQRKTSTFMAHNEDNAAKMGDTVSIAESRPLSRRKRWVVTGVVTKASV